MKRLLLAVALVAASQAHAVVYDQVVADKSAVRFTYQQMGVKVDGRFRRFSSQLSFDPAKPAAAKAALEVDLGSIDAGSKDADKEAVGKTFLDAKGFPKAGFVATSVKDLGSNRYEVSGRLTIKGRTQDVVFPATFTPQGRTGVLEGAFPIRRGDFGIGEGSWAKSDILANDIVVNFRLVAASGK